MDGLVGSFCRYINQDLWKSAQLSEEVKQDTELFAKIAAVINMDMVRVAHTTAKRRHTHTFLGGLPMQLPVAVRSVGLRQCTEPTRTADTDGTNK